jgi:hypothetical protein
MSLSYLKDVLVSFHEDVVVSMKGMSSLASLSVRVYRSSTSSTQRAALSCATAASRAEVSTTSIAATRVGSVAAATSYARVTFVSSAVTSMLTQDKSNGNKTQEE